MFKILALIPILVSFSSEANISDSTFFENKLSFNIENSQISSEIVKKEPEWHTVWSGSSFSYSYNFSNVYTEKIRFIVQASNGGTFTYNSLDSFSKHFSDSDVDTSSKGGFQDRCEATAMASGSITYSNKILRFSGGKAKDSDSEGSNYCRAYAEVILKSVQYYGYK